MMRRRNLAADSRGATIIEFALILPVMLALIMGMGELLYQLYVQSILSGAIQKAARDSAIQGGAQQASALDTSVMNAVWQIAAGATYTATRKSYSNFASVAPEPFTDTNGNGVRDAGECYSDINGNSTWDTDPGVTGQGGANDVTLYTITITYKRLFPVASLMGFSSSTTMSATTLLKNQPFATQSIPVAKTICI